MGTTSNYASSQGAGTAASFSSLMMSFTTSRGRSNLGFLLPSSGVVTETDQRSMAHDFVTDALARCTENPQLDVIAELRKHAKSFAFLDDLQERRDRLRKTWQDALSRHNKVSATPETGAAIASYHQSVVVPILETLVNEIVGLHCELALAKAHRRDDPLAS